MVRFPAKITQAIVPGTVFIPMHWGALWTDNGEANLLTHPEACPISLEPELKACAVNLTPVKSTESSNHQNYENKPLNKNSTTKQRSTIEESVSI